MSPLSARERRAIRLGGLIAGPVLLWLVAVGPWWTARSAARDELQRTAVLHLREQRLLDGQDALPAVEAALRARWGQDSLALLPAMTSGEASATLVARLQRVARDHDVRLTVLEPLPPAPAGSALTPVSITLRGESDFAGVLAFAAALENESPVVRLASFALAAREGSAGGRELLTLDATATGWWAPPESGP